MGWIGLNDGMDARFSTGGLAPDGSPLEEDAGLSAPDARLTAGTLFIETSHPAQDPLKLIAASGSEFWPAQLMLHLWPQGRATLQIGDGAAGLQLVTEFSRCAPGEHLRIMFRWSAAFNAVWLAVESPGRGMFAITRRAGPPPLPVAMLRQVFEMPPADHVSLLALSDRTEEIGLGPALAEGAPVRTPYGWRAVEELRPGDLVTSADSGPVAVREISRRVLPRAGSFAPAALETARGPVPVSPSARVLVPALEGRQEVLVNASELAGNAAAQGTGLLTYVEVTLERAHLINVGGHWIETRAPMPGPVARSRASGRGYELARGAA